MNQRWRELLVARVIRRYMEADGGTWATKIAWNAMIAFVPIVLVAAITLSTVLSAKTVIRVDRAIAGLVQNPQERASLVKTLESINGKRVALGAVGIIGLAWRASGLFSAMDNAFARIYGIASRPFLRQKLMALRMMLVFTLLLIPLLLTVLLLPSLRPLGLAPSHLGTTGVLIAQFVLGSLDGALIFAAIYHGVGSRHLYFREIVPGALVAGVLFESVLLLFPLYVSHASSIAGSSFGLLFILLGFFFWIGFITVVGACVNLELSKARGSTAG